MKINRILPEQRRSSLRQRLSASNRCLKIMEAHNGISALIASNARATDTTGTIQSFDGLWISGLTESAERGMPDIELHGLTSRIALAREIGRVSHMPIIVDGDTGGTQEQLIYNCLNFEEVGVSAIIVEDKIFPKNNSLDERKSQNLADPKEFAKKLKNAKASMLSKDFMIIARIEALIADQPMDDAIERAKRYLDGGADAIVIHSRKKDGVEVIEFANRYQDLKSNIPLVAIPTAYHLLTEDQLLKHGFKIAIYANHLLRSAYKAMYAAAELILKNHRAMEADALCEPVSTLLNMPLPGDYHEDRGP